MIRGADETELCTWTWTWLIQRFHHRWRTHLYLIHNAETSQHNLLTDLNKSLNHFCSLIVFMWLTDLYDLTKDTVTVMWALFTFWHDRNGLLSTDLADVFAKSWYKIEDNNQMRNIYCPGVNVADCIIRRCWFVIASQIKIIMSSLFYLIRTIWGWNDSCQSHNRQDLCQCFSSFIF